MQKHLDGTIVVSATDLVGYLACDHLVDARARSGSPGCARSRVRDDPELELLQERGDRHEHAYLERLRASRPDRSYEIAPELRSARTPGRAAGRRGGDARGGDARGVDVIFQATFFDGRWRGHADFLVRAERPSRLGAWSYDVADTKLARHVKAARSSRCASTPTCWRRSRASPPETLDRRHRRRRRARAAASPTTPRSTGSVKARFEARDLRGTCGPPRRPTPTRSTTAGSARWFPTCMDRRRADDHLSIVAGMTPDGDRTADRGDGVPTRRALGESAPWAGVARPEPGDARAAARAGRASRSRARTGPSSCTSSSSPIPTRPATVSPPCPSRRRSTCSSTSRPTRGSATTASSTCSAGPWRIVDGGRRLPPDLGATTATREKAAFEAFIDLVIERLDRDPAMHVYHYAGVRDRRRIKRLMQRHATREDEVDRILRGRGPRRPLPGRPPGHPRLGGVVLDQADREVLHGRPRGPGHRGRVQRRRRTRRWLRDHDDAAPARPGRLQPRRLRLDAPAARLARGAPARGGSRPGWDVARAAADRVAGCRARRRSPSAGGDPSARGGAEGRASRPTRPRGRADEAARWLLAGLLDWHRRDAQAGLVGVLPPRASSPLEDLLDESGPWRASSTTASVGEEQAVAHPPATGSRRRTRRSTSGTTTGRTATRARAGRGRDRSTSRRGTIDAPDRARQEERRPSASDLHRAGPVRRKPLPEALRPGGRPRDRRTGSTGPGPYRAVRDLLLRACRRGSPASTPGEALRRPGEPVLDAALRLARADLDESDARDPGTARHRQDVDRRAADRRARRGRAGGSASRPSRTRRSRTCWSSSMRRPARPAGAIRVLQRSDDETIDAGLPDVEVAGQSRRGRAGACAAGAVRRRRRHGLAVRAAEDMAGRVDVLVRRRGRPACRSPTSSRWAAADESIILLGDPNQLPQVSPGRPPRRRRARRPWSTSWGPTARSRPSAACSCDVTYRMHPRVNAFVSEAFYDGRLETDPSTARQAIAAADGADALGLRFVPVEHPGDETSSTLEADGGGRRDRRPARRRRGPTRTGAPGR